MSVQSTPKDIVTKDMLEEQFNVFGFKLFQYLDKQFDEVNRRMDGLDDIEADNHARDAQIARLERWIETIA